MSLVKTEEERNLITDLYNKYEQKMFHGAMDILCNSYSAEDAVHEAFLKIIDKLSDISFENEIKTEAFLITIVRNVAKNMYNRNKKDEPSEILEQVIEDDDAFLEYRRLEEKTAKEVISKLPEEYRQVIVMRYIFEIDIKEIAETIGISASAVYARINKAREIMRKTMEETYE